MHRSQCLVVAEPLSEEKIADLARAAGYEPILLSKLSGTTQLTPAEYLANHSNIYARVVIGQSVEAIAATEPYWPYVFIASSTIDQTAAAYGASHLPGFALKDEVALWSYLIWSRY